MKQWLDLRAQVQRHVDRGLDLGSVTSDRFAMFLYANNYYRVSGYGRCFYKPDQDRYRTGTSAEQLMDIYELDRLVRNLVLDGISVVEPTLKSRVAYHVARIVGGSEGYMDESFYLPSRPEPHSSDTKTHQRWCAELKNRKKILESFRELQDRDEIFIQHHVENGEPVPFWAIIEVVSMGTFSRFLRALRDKDVLTPVSKSLNVEDNDKLLQAVQNLSFLRNIAAHHGRLWNRRLHAHVALPQIALTVKQNYVASKTPAALLTLLAGMVDQIEGRHEYSKELLGLVHSTEEYARGCYHPIL
ncbi:MAG: Abi family protein [Kocuria sp.]|nr:Abi family protein [Kocuria sp.]